jgi:hypothetical protein
VTWAWVWTLFAFALVVAGAATIAVIALSGRDGGEVALAVLLVGFPALLGALALGIAALASARPTGAAWRSVRRWAIAFAGGLALLAGAAGLATGAAQAVLLLLAGISALGYLALDLRRGSGE